MAVENAYNQLRNYMQDIPSLFIYNAICVISDLASNRAGTITSGLDRFMESRFRRTKLSRSTESSRGEV